eukprot:gene40324-53296_t
MILADFLATALVTLLVVVDPPGLAPMFLAVTGGMNPQERRSVGWRACLIATAILWFFALAGEPFLRLLGISTAAFRIAGGLLLFWIAFEMVFERRNARKSNTAETAITKDHIQNVAAFPLAIPLMAGPGALTAIILLAGRAEGDPLRLAALAKESQALSAERSRLAASEPMSPALRGRIGTNEGATEAQKAILRMQEAERDRLGQQFDLERTRLERLWNGQAPGLEDAGRGVRPVETAASGIR